MDFDTEVRVARYGQRDFPRLVERIRSRKRGRQHGALRRARRLPRRRVGEQDGRKILVLYTDGGDTSSSITFDELRDLLRASDVTVYAIGFLEHQSHRDAMDQRMRLRQIAEITGGQAFFPIVDEGPRRVVREGAARRSRAVHARLPLDERRGPTARWRKVEIKLTRPDLQGPRESARARVTTRRTARTVRVSPATDIPP